jgi:integrase
LLYNCAELKPRAVALINRRDISALLASIRDGNPEAGKRPRKATAVRIHAHLGGFFRWCAEEEIIKTNPMANMRSPATIAPRSRFYSDDELKAIWSAADQLPLVEGSYVKLLALTALRRDELLLARWSEFDNPTEPTLFTVPTARIKLKAKAKLTADPHKRPVYRVPLAPWAQRLVKGLRREGELLFPNLDPRKLVAKLIKLGAPADFRFHTFRHTVATYFHNADKSEYERALVLNHSSGGTVTAGYSHGSPLGLKQTLLAEWAEHVERLVSPGKGIARLR